MRHPGPYAVDLAPIPRQMLRVFSAAMPSPVRTRPMRRERHAFTLIELLIVVVIIGILAAIAIPKFTNTRQQAYLATLKTDLRNLVTAQEAYFDNNAAYTTTIPTSLFDASTGVTIAVSTATATGWSGTATHVGLVGASITGCHVAVGTGETTATENEGAPYCP